MWLRLPLLSAAALLVGAANLSAQGIRGRVLDAETDRPIVGVSVALVDVNSNTVRGALTDSAGTFELPVRYTGRYHLRAERIGYQTVTSPPVEVSQGDSLVVELRMGADAVALAPLTVTAASRRSIRDRTLDDFYHRQRRGWGTFFGPGEIERIRPTSVIQLLQAVPGINIRYLRGMQTRVSMRSGRGDCTPNVYLDGTRLPAELLDAVVSGSSLRAVEVYTRAMETPGEFASGLNWNCGAIVIWTDLRVGP